MFSLQWFEKWDVYRAKMCVCVCHPTQIHSKEREKESEFSGFLPSMQKENMDQGLNNTSHCGKYIGLHFPLGAAASH